MKEYIFLKFYFLQNFDFIKIPCIFLLMLIQILLPISFMIIT